MIKTKRSFLEKLTGSKRIEPEENETEEIEISRGMQQLNNLYEYEEEDQEVQMSSPSPSPTNTMNEENLTTDDQNEGQLTIDVFQTETDIVIKSTIAGVKPEDLDVTINNDMVSIRGERKREEDVSEENYYYQECYWGTFSRSIILPVDVVSEKSEASMKNGILTIHLPKSDTNKTKKIQVRSF